MTGSFPCSCLRNFSAGASSSPGVACASSLGPRSSLPGRQGGRDCHGNEADAYTLLLDLLRLQHACGGGGNAQLGRGAVDMARAL